MFVIYVSKIKDKTQLQIAEFVLKGNQLRYQYHLICDKNEFEYLKK